MAVTPTIHIKLLRSGTQLDNWQFLKVFRLRVDVTEIKGIDDDRIFVYAQQPVDPYTGVTADWFQCVASAVDMVEYPGGSPPTDGSTPFFRLNYVELDLRAASEADLIWQLIQNEVNVLCEALMAVQTVAPSDEVWCGGPPDATDSVSASTSTSV